MKINMWIPKQLTKDLHIHLCRYFGNYVFYMIIQTFVCHNPVIYKFDDQKKKKRRIKPIIRKTLQDIL